MTGDRDGSTGARGARGRLFRSLRVRMALSHAAVLALILLVLGGVGYVLLASRLHHDAAAAVRAAAVDEADRLRRNGPVAIPPDDDVPSATAVQTAIYLPGGRALGESARVPPWLRPQRATSTTIDVRGERALIVTLHVVARGRTVGTAVAGTSLEPQDTLLRRVRLLLLIGGLLGVVVSLWAGWWLAGRAARPVRDAYDAQASFASNASHELRTPLAFVRTGVEVLAERDPPLGEQVLGEIDYLTALTERLLGMARMRADVPRRTQPVADVAAACRASVARNARVHRVRTEVDLEGAPAAAADPVALEAVLDAVLENVARHGGGIAKLTVRRSDGHVDIAVADHGAGLAPELRARAFDRFFRADPARTRSEGGAGLGLSLARSIVETQGGRIWLEETPGGGLTTRIELHAAS